MSDEDIKAAMISAKIHSFFLSLRYTWLGKILIAIGSFLWLLTKKLFEAVGIVLLTIFIAAMVMVVFYVTAVFIQHGPDAGLELLHHRLLLWTNSY